MFQVLKHGRKYPGAHCSFYSSPKHLVWFSFSFRTFSHTKPRRPFFFLNFILWHAVFVPIYFSRRITASIPWKGLCNPAMTGAFSCCWNYVRHPKISKTSKFQGKSSLLGFIAAMKEEGAGWSWNLSRSCLVGGCPELCPSHTSTRGAASCSGNPVAGDFRGRSGFCCSKCQVLTNQATSSAYTLWLGSERRVEIIPGLWKQFCSHVRGSSTPACRSAHSL